MAATNLTVRVSADTADLTGKLGVAKASVADFAKEHRQLAAQISRGDGSEQLKLRYLELSQSLQQAKSTQTLYERELKRTQVTTASLVGITGSQRAGLQQLTYNLGDVSTMYSMGAKTSQIFASQSSQVFQSIQLLAGETSGFAKFLASGWGMAFQVATASVLPLVGRLFETEKALDSTKDAMKEVQFASNAVGTAQSILGGVMDMATGRVNEQTRAYIALARAQLAVAQIESRERQAKAGEQIGQFTSQYGPRYNAAAERGVFQQDKPLAALNDDLQSGRKNVDQVIRSLEGMVATGQLTRGMFSDLAKAYANFGVEAANQQAFKDAEKLLDGTGGRNLLKPENKSGSGDSAAKKAAQEREAAERAALNERLQRYQQQEAISQQAARTEAEISRIALQSKLADIDILARAGKLSDAEAVQQRANLNDQLGTLEEDLQMRLYMAQLQQLTSSRERYDKLSAEYADYTRRIELLSKAHLGRMAVSQAQAAEREKEAARQLSASQIAEDQKQAQKKRQIMDQTYRPYAQQIANMITLQQGFGQTVKSIWSSLANTVNQAVANMVMSFITGLFAKEVASDRFHIKEVMKSAREAAANAWSATAKIPIIGPIAAPVAAAAAFAGVMAFSAEDGWDVPGGAGAGVDGKGGRLSIIHPREMVLPAQIADTVRMTAASQSMPVRMATMSQNAMEALHSQRVDEAAASAARPMTGSRARGSVASMAEMIAGYGGASGGRAASAPAAARAPDAPIIIQAVDARSVTRLMTDNNRGVAKALQKAVRANVRPS